MLFSSKSWRKVSGGVCDVSLIIFDKTPCKIFSNNSKLWLFWTPTMSHTYFISFTLGESSHEKTKIFIVVQSNGLVFAGFNHIKFCCSEMGVLFILFCKLQKWYVDLYLKKMFFKKIKVRLPSSKNKKYYLCHWKPFKNDEECFLFHLKSSFHSQDI